MKKSKVKYNPTLSVDEIANRSGVGVDAVKKYIKENGIDRRYERKVNIVNTIRKVLKQYPHATKTEVAQKTKYSIGTVRTYWDVAQGRKELIKSNTCKVPKITIRELQNFYATHPSVTADLLREEKFNAEILEPFCGSGTMADVIKSNGHIVHAYDIIDRNYGEVADFFTTKFEKGRYDIITNPPYCENLNEIVAKCLRIARDKVALLLPIKYFSGKARHEDIYMKTPPTRVYVYIERICIAKNADFITYSEAGANMEIYAWFIWDKSVETKQTELKWIHNK